MSSFKNHHNDIRLIAEERGCVLKFPTISAENDKNDSIFEHQMRHQVLCTNKTNNEVVELERLNQLMQQKLLTQIHSQH